MRVKGHWLMNEGAPHDDDGVRMKATLGRWSTSGEGRAKCSCGELSEVLPSGSRRQQWHREHKAEVVAC